MVEQMLKVTKNVKIIPILLTIMLAVSMNSVAFAAPPLQEGENQEGQNQVGDEQQENEDDGDDNQQQMTQPQSQSQQGTQQGTMQQGTQPQSQSQQGTQQGQFQQGTQQQGQFQQTSGACAQQYTVQAGDTLSLIASRFLGDVGAYSQIQQATNAAGANFATIDDPNIIEVGETLCIPAQAGQQAGMQQGQQGQFQQDGQQAGMQQGTMNNSMLSVPQGMSKVIFENLSSRDLIVDVSGGPSPQSVWVEPGTRQQFVVQPGQYTVMGHQPGGEFGVTPEQVQLTSGGLIAITCYDNSDCRTAQSNQEILALLDEGQGMGQGTMQQGQQGTMQQGNQQGTMQQDGQQGTMQQGNQQGTMQQDGQQGTTQQDGQQGTTQQNDDGQNDDGQNDDGQNDDGQDDQGSDG